MARRIWGEGTAVLTALFYFGSHDLLRASSHCTGINIAIFFMVLALYLLVIHRQEITSGLLLACGALTGFYIMPGALMALTLLFIADPAKSKRATLAFFGMLLGTNLVFILVFGYSYLEPVYLYHFNKPGIGGSNLKMFNSVLFHNPWLFHALLLTLPIIILKITGWFSSDRTTPKTQPFKNQKNTRHFNAGLKSLSAFRQKLLKSQNRSHALILACWLFALGYLVFIWSLKRTFHFYYLLPFPALSLLAASSFWAIWLYGQERVKLYRSITTYKGKREKNRPQRFRLRWVAFLAFWLFILTMLPLVRNYSQQQLSYFKRLKGTTSYYNWQNSPPLGYLNQVFKKLFWPQGRTISKFYLGVNYYLWHESRYLTIAPQMAQYVKTNSLPDQTIFGDSTTAPLVALLSDRKISADFADTNSMRFRSKTTTVEQCLNKIALQQPKFIIAGQRRGFYNLPGFKRYIEKNYQKVKTFQDPYFGRYLIFEYARK